jgi:hypothetical protein
VFGVVSAGCELVVAAIFLRRAEYGLPDALAFGTGIGIFEMIVIGLGVGMIQLADAGLPPTPGTIARMFGWLFLLERGYTLVGHAASRLLVYRAVRARWWTPALLTLVCFSVGDGIATYGDVRNWEWDAPAIALGVHGSMIALTLAEVVAAWICWRSTPRRGSS